MVQTQFSENSFAVKSTTDEQQYNDFIVKGNVATKIIAVKHNEVIKKLKITVQLSHGLDKKGKIFLDKLNENIVIKMGKIALDIGLGREEQVIGRRGNVSPKNVTNVKFILGDRGTFKAQKCYGGIKSDSSKVIASDSPQRPSNFPRANFISFYRAQFTDFPDLRMSEKELTAFMDKYSKVADNFELNTEWNPSMKLILTEIHKKIQSGVFGKNKEQIKQLVNEMIVLNSLTPIKITKMGKSNIQRQSIEITTLNHMETVLNSVAQQKDGNLKNNSYFSHIDPKAFAKASISEKMISLNLTNLDQSTREYVLNNEFYKKSTMQIALNGNSVDWMFACSGGLEQVYLNTCVSASACQDITSRLILLPIAIALSEKTLNEIDTNRPQASDPAMQKYYESRRDYTRTQLETLKSDLLNDIRRVKPSNPRQHTLKWSKIMQQVGLLTNIDKLLGHPTKKPIKDHWLLSLIIMIPVVLFQHLVGSSSNPPYIRMRAGGIKSVNQVIPRGIVNTKLKYQDFNSLLNIIRKPEIFIKIADKASEIANAALNEVWSTLNHHGGTSLSLSTLGKHSIFIKAVKLQNKKVILIGDPKESSYKVMNFAQFKTFVQEQTKIKVKEK